MSISRLVTLLTPVFAGLAGWLVTLAAKYLPGNPALDSTELTAVFVAGALLAAHAAAKWLDGRGKFDAAVAATQPATIPKDAEKVVVEPQEDTVVPDDNLDLFLAALAARLEARK